MQPIRLESHYLLHLMSAVLKGIQPQNPPDKLNWENLYKLAAWHGVSNMVCYGINRLMCASQPPHDVMEKFRNDCLLHNEIGQSCKRNSPLLQ
ncbi:MAG: hypothetical protein ACYDEJ_06405 [Desulfitobacteriaceae bacterium]